MSNSTKYFSFVFVKNIVLPSPESTKPMGGRCLSPLQMSNNNARESYAKGQNDIEPSQPHHSIVFIMHYWHN
jgi:hypothetical protein